MHQQWKKDVAKRAPSTKEEADVDKFGSVLLFIPNILLVSDCPRDAYM